MCAATNATQVTGSLGISSAAGKALAGKDGRVEVGACLEHEWCMRVTDAKVEGGRHVMLVASEQTPEGRVRVATYTEDMVVDLWSVGRWSPEWVPEYEKGQAKCKGDTSASHGAGVTC